MEIHVIQEALPTIIADGILFIGDPHQTSRAPGRRIDAVFYEERERNKNITTMFSISSLK